MSVNEPRVLVTKPGLLDGRLFLCRFAGNYPPDGTGWCCSLAGRNSPTAPRSYCGPSSWGSAAAARLNDPPVNLTAIPLHRDEQPDTPPLPPLCRGHLLLTSLAPSCEEPAAPVGARPTGPANHRQGALCPLCLRTTGPAPAVTAHAQCRHRSATCWARGHHLWWSLLAGPGSACVKGHRGNV